MIFYGYTGGNDTFIGGAGDDLVQDSVGVYAAPGGGLVHDRDTYVFATGDGADTYRKFDLFNDRIDVTGLGLARADMAALSISQAGFDFLIDFGNGDSITLDDVLFSVGGFGPSLEQLRASLTFLTTDGVQTGLAYTDRQDERLVVTTQSQPLYFDGGAGHDVVDFSAVSSGTGWGVHLVPGNSESYTPTLESVFFGNGLFVHVEEIVGTAYKDLVFFDEHAMIFDGGAGADEIFGGSGRDTLTGGAGSDRFIAQAATFPPAMHDHDVITDFELGPDGDRLLYANSDRSGDPVIAMSEAQFRAALSGDETHILWTWGQDRSVRLEGLDFTDAAVVDALVAQTGNLMGNLLGNQDTSSLTGTGMSDVFRIKYGQTATGHAGADVFIVEGNPGAGRISDFGVTEDRLDFSWLFMQAADMAGLTVSAVGQGIAIDFGDGRVLTLDGVSLAEAEAVRTAVTDGVTIGFTGQRLFEGTHGDDSLTGTAGDDLFLYSAGNDTIDGGAGFDTVDYSGWAVDGPVGMDATFVGDSTDGAYLGTSGFDALRNIEHLIGTDVVDGVQNFGPTALRIETGDGNDLIAAGANDTVTGGAGEDYFIFRTATNGATPGVSVITDFTTDPASPDADTLQLHDSQQMEEAAFLANISGTADHLDLLLNNGDTVRFEGLSAVDDAAALWDRVVNVENPPPPDPPAMD